MNTINKKYLAIIVISLSVFIFVISDSLVKYLDSSFSPIQIVFFRSLFGMVPLILSLFFNRTASILSIPKPKSLFFCSFIGAFAILFIVKGLGMIPLAHFYAIQFSGPLIMTALAVPLLEERIKAYRGFLIFVGFLSVLIILNPTSFNEITEGSLYALSGVFLLSLFLVQIRQLSRVMSTLTIVFYTTLIQGIIMGLLMIDVWKTPTLSEFAILGTMGILGTIAQMINAKGYSMAPIQITAPFEYTNIIWGVFFGYFFWNEVPGATITFGATLLLISGILLVHETHREAKASTAPC